MRKNKRRKSDLMVDKRDKIVIKILMEKYGMPPGNAARLVNKHQTNIHDKPEESAKRLKNIYDVTKMLKTKKAGRRRR